MIAMTWFVAWDNGISLTHMAAYGLFGVFLIVIAFISLQKGSPLGLAALPHWLKYVYGSFAMAFAIWMLGSVILLPFVGYAGFELLQKPWSGVGFLLLALVLLPITRRYMS
jgi:hypothetical protein